MSQITGPLNAIVGDQYDYSLVPAITGTYTWNVVNGEIISGQGTATITVQFILPGQNEIKLDVQDEHGAIAKFVIVVDTTVAA